MFRIYILKKYKLLMKEINKCRDTLSSWMERLNIIKMSILSKLIYRFNTMSIKITEWFFVDLIFFEFYFTYFFIQQVLISQQLYTHQCIHVNHNHPIHHTTTPTRPPLSPLWVHTFVLYIYVSISALQTSSSVPFF